MAKKKYPTGVAFYKDQGLKPVIVYLTKEEHAASIEIAKEEGRTLQKQIHRFVADGIERKRR